MDTQTLIRRALRNAQRQQLQLPNAPVEAWTDAQLVALLSLTTGLDAQALDDATLERLARGEDGN
jgi:hypothetical protein